MIEAHRIGDRHEHDLGREPAVGIELRETLLQHERREHRGRLVRVQRGLQILRPVSAGPK